jgi:ribosomal protein S18 acetylase RimI-like enzyme
LATLNLISPDAITRPASIEDARLVHQLYLDTPGYFDIISIPVPTLNEVQRELLAARDDARRFTELVVLPPEEAAAVAIEDGATGGRVVGYLDYTLNYPEQGDATVNLLLVHSVAQSRGIGRRCVADLEARLRGRSRRVLASIYGQNPRAKRFWRSLGYRFAIDAQPLLDWYAKSV